MRSCSVFAILIKLLETLTVTVPPKVDVRRSLDFAIDSRGNWPVSLVIHGISKKKKKSFR